MRRVQHHFCGILTKKNNNNNLNLIMRKHHTNPNCRDILSNTWIVLFKSFRFVKDKGNTEKLSPIGDTKERQLIAVWDSGLNSGIEGQ